MNLPNILAVFRIVLAPVLFFLLTHDFTHDIESMGVQSTGVHQSWVNYFAALAFGVAALTDFFDGYIARAWGQKTRLGAILDPLADKMLMLAAFLGLLVLGRADAWVIYLILVREFFITGFRVVMVAENVDISASFAGKLKTTFQMIAVIFLIMQDFEGAALFAWCVKLHLGTLCLYIALILTLYSGFEYIYKYQKHLKSHSAVNLKAKKPEKSLNSTALKAKNSAKNSAKISTNLEKNSGKKSVNLASENSAKNSAKNSVNSKTISSENSVKKSENLASENSIKKSEKSAKKSVNSTKNLAKNSTKISANLEKNSAKNSAKNSTNLKPNSAQKSVNSTKISANSKPNLSKNSAKNSAKKSKISPKKSVNSASKNSVKKSEKSAKNSAKNSSQKDKNK